MTSIGITILLEVKMLFDEMKREDRTEKSYGESSFSYLNRTGRPEYAEVREILEQWYASYPDGAEDNLRNRFRSDNDRHFQGAFFELYCYVIMSTHGYTVYVHPEVAGVETTPDFFVCDNDKRMFYLEATVAGEDTESEKESKMRGKIYDCINDMEIRDWWFYVDVVRINSDQQPSTNKLKRWLRTLADQLKVEEIEKQVEEEGVGSVATYSFRHNGWVIQFLPIPRSPPLRDDTSVRAAGMTSDGDARWGIDIRRSVFNSLNAKKASRYGNPSAPYVVAVNALDPYVEMSMFNEILFGKQEGFWIGVDGRPQNTGVSGVLAVEHLVAYAMARCTPIMWHNPWARYPLDADVWSGPQMIFDESNRRVKSVAGKSIREILGLPEYRLNW